MYIFNRTSLVFHISKRKCSKTSFDFALDPLNKQKCIETIKKTKAIRWLPHIKMERNAAVLIPLCHVEGELSLLFTLRTSNIKKHRGQVSFPGGVQDPEDGTLVKTALRETHEELGIPEDVIDVWCHGPSIAAFVSKMYVTPVVGYINGSIIPEQLKINPTEVEEAFTVPLRVLCKPENFRRTQFRSGVVTPVFLGGKRRVWGLTAMITHFFLKSLLPGDVYRHQLNYVKPYVKCVVEKDNVGPPI